MVEINFSSSMTLQLTDPVFFSTPDNERFALYPTPKLADFGSSRSLADPGVRNRGEVVRRDACCMLFAPPVRIRLN